MGKVIGLAVLVAAVVLGGWLWTRGGDDAAERMRPAEKSAPSGTAAKPAGENQAPVASGEMKTYTMDEVAAHADRSSCWTTVRGNVYDLTGAIDKHPGGPDKILGLCGKDGTKAFEGQHGGMEKPEAGLASAQIGVLAK